MHGLRERSGAGHQDAARRGPDLELAIRVGESPSYLHSCPAERCSNTIRDADDDSPGRILDRDEVRRAEPPRFRGHDAHHRRGRADREQAGVADR